MRIERMGALTVLLLILGMNTLIAAQSQQNESAIAAKSAVQVLTGTGDGFLDKTGLGVIVKSNGVILTSYGLVKDATEVQIRLSNGEVFDTVDLIAKDERRGIAALKIPGYNLPALSLSQTSFEEGSANLITFDTGESARIHRALLKGTALADDIKDAGEGFRMVRFTSSIDEYTDGGGILIDADGFGVGFIVRKLYTSNSANYAIPLASVAGLGNMSGKIMSFENAASLKLKQTVRSPAAIEVVSRDPGEILKSAKLFYVYSGSFYIKARMMENALMMKSQFKNGALMLVNERKTADILINVEHRLYSWDYRYTLTDRKSGIILASEKVTDWDGKAASKRFAKKLLRLLAANSNPAFGPVRRPTE